MNVPFVICFFYFPHYPFKTIVGYVHYILSQQEQAFLQPIILRFPLARAQKAPYMVFVAYCEVLTPSGKIHS